MIWRKELLIIAFLIFYHTGWAQQNPNDTTPWHFRGNASITNNGFSLVPSFSLGKPATVIDLSVGTKRFSFDPQFRFDLDGLKPWSFIFIWRYKIVDHKKFQLKAGVHLPALAYRSMQVVNNGIADNKLVVQRFFTPELSSRYNISKNININTYYIYGRGLEKRDQSQNTHFFSLRAGFNDIRLPGGISIQFNPQVYYLNIDNTDGFFTASTITLGMKDVPLSISTMINKEVSSEIKTKAFDWNISLVYSFSSSFVNK